MIRIAATLATMRAQLTDRVNRAGRRDTGATTIEYAVIAGAVCILAIALVAIIKGAVESHSAGIK